jgi:hypothetical protein
VFGGGPFYSGGTLVMNTLGASGFTTVILWSIHPDSSTGNLILNDQLVVSNGLLGEVGLKRHYKTSEPVKSLRGGKTKG